MNYKVIPLEHKEEWDSIVKSFANYDVYYLNGYVQAFHLIGDGEPFLFYYEEGSTRAMNVFMKRDLASLPMLKNELEPGKYFDIVTPYGYGGFILEGNGFEHLKYTYEQFCKEEHIVCEFVRFHPLFRNWAGLADFYDIRHTGDTVYIDLRSKDYIWGNFTSKNRNMVRKAQKADLKVYWGRDGSIVSEFMEIYNKTMEKDQSADFYFFKKEFYESVLYDLKYNAMWFYAKTGCEITSIAIFLYGNKTMHYHLSASRKEYQHLAPTNLLLYEAALWGNENGYETLHLGGGVGSQKDNLYKFKKAFNRLSDSEFYTGRKIFIPYKYEEFVQKRKEQNNFNGSSSFFPLYRQ